jgi:hypothetical protein
MFSLSAALEKCSSSASTIADCSSRISGKIITILQSADSGRDRCEKLVQFFDDFREAPWRFRESRPL